MRDDVALALSEACVARGVPLFGICRGLQEMNVAFGGSLHPEIRELPGRMNHRMPRLENGEIHPDPQGDLRRPPRGQPGRRAAPLRRSSAARPSGSIRCTGRAFSSPASGSSSRAPRRTAPSRRSGSRTRRLCARRAMACRVRSAEESRSTARCFRRSARRFRPSSADDGPRSREPATSSPTRRLRHVYGAGEVRPISAMNHPTR